MTAIKQKYSARIKSVLIPKVKIYTGETQELLDESILIRAIVKIPRDIRRLKVTKGNIKKKHLAPNKIYQIAQENLNRTSLVAPVCRRGRGSAMLLLACGK